MLFCNFLLSVNVWFLFTSQEADTFGLDFEPTSFGALVRGSALVDNESSTADTATEGEREKASK